MTRSPVWLARSKKCTKSRSPVKSWTPCTVSWKFQGTYLCGANILSKGRRLSNYNRSLRFIGLTLGWHWVQSCTSWTADPSSRTVGFWSNEYCLRCTEKASHLSGNSCSCSLWRMISLQTPAREASTCKRLVHHSWVSLLLRLHAVQ